MTTLVHLSDLHFGRVDERLLDPLVAAVVAVAPDVVVVSGDLTQRARTAEFEAAGRFLDRLPRPRIVVPGNHDVPLYNVLDRALRPVAAFRRFIEAEPMPRFVDDRVAVVGLNTARSMVVKNGRVNERQLAALRGLLEPLPAGVVRVVVTHHPFDAGEGMDPRDRIGRAALGMRTFADCGVDVLLSGHLHATWSGQSGLSARVLEGYGALAVSAGTATSTRLRAEPNEFNVLRLAKTRVLVQRQAWDAARGAFEPAGESAFGRSAAGWLALAAGGALLAR
jgi:3',5'-cyclic AMP phosphodiesterase CpdA